MRAPGDVYRIPAHEHEGADPKNRRQVLMHACAQHGNVRGSFAYATREPTQHRCGHPVVKLAPEGDTGDGAIATAIFPEKTFVFPGVIASVQGHSLGRYYGTVSPEELAGIRAALPTALGYRTGVRADSPDYGDPRRWGKARPTLRGVVYGFGPELTAYLAQDVDEETERLRAGVVITPHDASRHRDAYLTLVPVLGGFEPAGPDDVALTRDGEDWLDYLRPDLRAAGEPVEVAVVLAGEAFYVHKSALTPPDPARVLSISAVGMERVEDALLDRLRRDTPPPGEELDGDAEAHSVDDGVGGAEERTGPTSSSG